MANAEILELSDRAHSVIALVQREAAATPLDQQTAFTQRAADALALALAELDRMHDRLVTQ